ncbi:MAG: GDSL-type esterase/lipase family protein [Firmicutes bacterium]|nr:GDSL-type esterase/lipase family protein [Bacillota bacterium]
MLKKFIPIFLAAVLTATAASADSVTVLLYGEALECSVEPFITEGTTFVPMRSIFEALGAEIEWDEETRTVTSQKDGVEISITIGSEQAYKNGEAYTLTAAPMITDGYTMVPLRFVSESFGCVVSWDGDTQTVTIEENPLTNSTVGVIGDSISYGTNYAGGYAKILSENNNLTAVNEAKGGATITRNVKWSDDSQSYRPCIIDMLDALPEELDYLIMQGGINDFWCHVELGSLDGSLDDTTFAGALETLFKNAKEKYPDSKIGFVINHDPFTYDAESSYEPYYEMIKAACEKWDIPYLDLYALNNTEVGVNVKDEEMCRLYFESEERPGGDGTHPNRLGYETIYVQPITEWLQSL